MTYEAFRSPSPPRFRLTNLTFLSHKVAIDGTHIKDSSWAEAETEPNSFGKGDLSSFGHDGFHTSIV